MFNPFTKKQEIHLNACVDGYVKALDQVNDPVFSKGYIGPGIAIEPTSNVIFAPVSGMVKVLFPTFHAIGLVTPSGQEVLIHIGIDTVKLKGQGFEALIAQGDVVEVGKPLVKFDLDFLKSQNIISDVIMVITSPMVKLDMIQHQLSNPINKNQCIITLRSL